MLDILAFDWLKFFVGFLIVITILYWYLTRNNDYWEKQGIIGPKPVLLFGTFLDRLKDNLGLLDVQYMEKYGGVYGLFDGTSPVLEIADPELIKEVLVKEFHRFNNRRELRTEHQIINKLLFFSRGEDWKRVRTITGSTFTQSKMKNLYGLVRKCLQECIGELDDIADRGQGMNAKEMFENFSMDVIASCAFATETNCIKDPNNSFLVNSRKFFELKAARSIAGFIFPKFLNRLLNIKTHLDPEASDWIISFTKHIIEKRRQSGEKNIDFLQLLIDAKADDNKREDIIGGLESQYVNNDEDDITYDKKKYGNKSLTEDEIIAQSFIFMLAGFETTSTTLAYISREMALNPECQQKLYNEVMAAMGADGEISYDDLHRLPYLDACISETLRFHSPFTRVEREVNQNYKLGKSQIRLFKGQLVEIPVYAIHHSEKYFRNAEQYIPDRFLPENRNQIIPYTFMPFGTGPRNCIGMRFALMEIKLAMAHIIMRYRFTKSDKTEEKLKFKIVTPLLTPFSVNVGIEKR